MVDDSIARANAIDCSINFCQGICTNPRDGIVFGATQWVKQRVHYFCDNETIVAVIDRRTSKHSLLIYRAPVDTQMHISSRRALRSDHENHLHACSGKIQRAC